MSSLSLDWIKFSEGPWTRRRKHQVIVWNEKILLLGGFDGETALDLNDVWSLEGNTWSLVCERAGWSGRDGHCAVVCNGSVFVLGGTDDPFNCKCDVWKSLDGGRSWIQLCDFAPWPERWQHAGCVHDNKIYITGGWGDHYFNDVWCSSDGVQWELVCASAPWKPRMFHSAISFNGAIYIIGGHDGRTQLRDVWASNDGGRNWTQVCHTAQWQGRQGHATVVLDGHVYIMGGFGGSTRFSDLWESRDCAHWVQVSRQCSWSARQGHAACALNGCLYLFGGFDESGYCNNSYRLALSDYARNSADSAVATERSLNSPEQTTSHPSDEDEEVFLLEGVEMIPSTPPSASPAQLRSISSGPRHKPITVSLTTVMESIEGLRGHRMTHERLMQGLVNGIAIVMHAVNFTASEHMLEVEEEGAANMSVDSVNRGISRSDSGDVVNNIASKRFRLSYDRDKDTNTTSQQGIVSEGLNKQNSFIEKTPNKLTQSTSEKLPSKLKNVSSDKLALNRPTASRSHDEIFESLAKVGSPFRENLVDKIRCGGTSSTSNSAFKSNEDFQMQFWKLIPTLFFTSGPGVTSTISSNNPASQSANPVQFNALNSTIRDMSSDGISGTTSSAQQTGSNGKTSTDQTGPSSSAVLRERMERDKGILRILQSKIRNAAEVGDMVTVDELVKQRTELSGKAFTQAQELSRHIEYVAHIQDLRQRHLTNMLLKLTDLSNLFSNVCPPSQLPVFSRGVSNGSNHNNSNSKISSSVASSDSFVYCSWSEWEEVMDKCGRILNKLNSAPTEMAIYTLIDNMRHTARCSNEISEWMYRDCIVSCNMLGNSNDESASKHRTISDIERNIHQLAVNNASSSVQFVGGAYQDYIKMSTEYQELLDSQDVYRMNVKLAADKEVDCITTMEKDSIDLLRLALDKGFDLIRSMKHQNNLDLMEISGLQTEVNEWNEKVGRLKDSQELQAFCDRLIQENSKLEENLLRLEDERIDIKSSLEKASLKGNRRVYTRSAPSNSSIMSNGSSKDNGPPSIGKTTSADENELPLVKEFKEKLTNAEKSVKKARRDLRSWYREHRRFAIELVPELFHYLPDFITPGSILGDGGFAENARIPRRRLDEYDDITRLNVNIPPSSSSSNATADSSPFDLNQKEPASSRHILLKATYEGEEVILKGFVMHNYDQRKGLEREISILGRLKSDSIICPGAIVEGSSGDVNDPSLQVTIFIEYPYCRGGNLSQWLKASPRKPWEMQSVARQILYGLMYLHDHGVVHKDVKPSNVLMHEDGRLVLTDFEISREVKVFGGMNSAGAGSNSGGAGGYGGGADEYDDVTTTVVKAGTRGFMAPEIESGGQAVYASDMYSFGVLLYYMHFPTQIANFLPGHPVFPHNNDAELADLIQSLLQLDHTARPTAAAALMHSYFRTTFVDRLMQDGEVVEQDRKLEAVRNLLSRTRYANRANFDKITVRRDNVLKDTLDYFIAMPLEKMRASLKVTFIGEPGIDEGGLLTEMFSIFFESVFQESSALFEGSAEVQGGAKKRTFSQDLASSFSARENNGKLSSSSTDSADIHDTTDSSTMDVIVDDSQMRTVNEVVLPCGANTSEEQLETYRAIGRSIVKALYEGRRIGSRLCPSVFKFITNSSPNMRDLQMFDPQTAKSLQWTLATVGVEEFGLHFESVGAPELGVVTDSNKSKFVRMKIDSILVSSRVAQLEAIKTGFSEALRAISEEAAPFMSLLSHTDWRVMLCGDSAVSAPQIIAALVFTGFSKKSELPQWLKEILLASSEDHLRKFLVFATGSPSLSTSSFSTSSSAGAGVKINVRFQSRTGSLLVAHTCFFQLDIPNYKDKETLQNKLFYSIQNANTFEIV